MGKKRRMMANRKKFGRKYANHPRLREAGVEDIPAPKEEAKPVAAAPEPAPEPTPKPTTKRAVRKRRVSTAKKKED